MLYIVRKRGEKIYITLEDGSRVIITVQQTGYHALIAVDVPSHIEVYKKSEINN